MKDRVLGVNVDVVDYAAAVSRISIWAKARESRFVCIANTHVVMEAYDHADFRRMLNQADLTTPDGMPLAWMLRLKGHPIHDRVYGPTLMRQVLAAAERAGAPVGFYGSTEIVLGRLGQRLLVEHPKLQSAFCFSPPFRELSADEDDEVCRRINESGARILFVGLGCPKQERWIAAHRGRIQAVMLGVGAAFDFLAGTKRQAPAWMQRMGLEWLFRMIREPRRLWKRYLLHNPRFAILASAELLGLWRPGV